MIKRVNQRSLIKSKPHPCEEFAFGYDKSSCGSFKILMYCYDIGQYEIYDSNSSSWKVIDDAPPDETSPILAASLERVSLERVSLKGDTYWYARYRDRKSCDVLVCFDFTRDRFGPHLPLPFDASIVHDVSLSTVREEKLVVLVKKWDTYMMEVWVTNKIEPVAVSWTNFLKVYMNPTVRWYIPFGKRMFRTCIIGENGYFTKVDLRKCIDIQLEPFVASYVPTSAQIT
ncbi:hypothetical protein N665_0011s0126 [Sinapis alba]|nr:hypothetical protein N665_0011s0126 [Sinapis alba]